MSPPGHTPNGVLARHGATWLAMIGMAVAGISWALGLAGKVENQQAQIAALQMEVANRRGAMSLIESVQRDVTRIEHSQVQLHEELDERGAYKEVLARMEEHIRALDDRMVQVERAFGWRDRGPGTGPAVR